ncbi:MAG: hypothetical protein SGARI_002919 [Bacillariaceae sp.]
MSLVMSYVTIRIYTLFVDPILSRLSSSGAAAPSTGTEHLLRSPSSSGLSGQRRTSLMTAKDLDVFSKLKKIDEEGEEEENDDESSALSPSSAKLKQKKQPIDLSGSYQLVENHNFEAFLVAQGLPWMLARAANKARPIHHITHLGKFITIRIEGIIESTSTYEINGEPVEGLIRGRLFADQVTYLTYQDLALDDGSFQHDEAATAAANSLSKSASRISNESEGSKHSVGEKWKTAVDDITHNYDEFAGNVKKNLGQVFKSTPIKDGIMGASKGSSATKYAAAKTGVPPPAASSNSITVKEPSTDETATSDVNENRSETTQATPQPTTVTALATSMTPKKSHICGLKTTKRAINDGYTITVSRKLSADKSRITMFSAVEFDDPAKEDIESKQFFDRVKGT